MQLRKLDSQEILSIYTDHSVRHFPRNERKPISSIRRMAKEGIYTGYGLFEKEGELLAYGFFTILPDKKTILLDYFAVMEQYRSCGIGSSFLKYTETALADYDGILIESENPDYAANEEERLVRDKRIAFYNRNGAIFTGILAKAFGVHYKVLFFPILSTPEKDSLCDDLRAIYQYMVPKILYKTQIHIS